MRKVGSPSRFDPEHGIEYFSGKDYGASIQLAEQWAARTELDLSKKASSPITVQLVSYYEQIAFHKSILVSYAILSDVGNLNAK